MASQSGQDVLSIVIPAKTEQFLTRTVQDVLEKAQGEVEIFPVLDGYELPAEEVIPDGRVHYVHFEPTRHSKKRQAINYVCEHSAGNYLMSLDAHCMLAPGFDVQLIHDQQESGAEVLVPRRHRLDAENWCLQTQVDDRPPIDYEYLMWPWKFDPPAFHGFKWDERTLARTAVEIDEIITFQGSCWLMTKDWFRQCGFMQVTGYQGWGQEAEEISFTTWYLGGRVCVDKRTWYAHLHKGPKYGRMYYLPRDEQRASYQYAFDLWARQRQDFLLQLVDYLGPMPGWPSDWREQFDARTNP